MKHRNTTAERSPEAFTKLQQFVQQIGVAMITTVTPDGALRSRPMATREFTDDGEIWFFTADDSGKIRDLDAEHAVNLSYADTAKQHYVSVTGSATLVRDRERMRELWDPIEKTWFPRGLDDPHLALLRVRIENAEYWDSASGKMTHLLKRAVANTRDSGEHTKVEIRSTPASG